MRANNVKKSVSIVVPTFNEELGIRDFYKSLQSVLQSLKMYTYEFIIVDDGSSDNTVNEIKRLLKNDSHNRLICLSRNFGKEIATTAGIHEATGDAVITIDADGQHPVELIPKFLEKWESGARVVVGIRTENYNEGFVKRQGSKAFYRFFNRFTGIKIIPQSTDFRLIDHTVQQEFIRLNERHRVTRGLIDWLGYRQEYIEFQANPRLVGRSGYSFKKLFKLAIDSVVSLSTSPLYITAYIGAVILPISVLLGLFMLVDKFLGDPLHLRATGSAYVLVLLLFLFGVMMVSQGIIGLYISHIHMETKGRPLYIVDTKRSVRQREE